MIVGYCPEKISIELQMAPPPTLYHILSFSCHHLKAIAYFKKWESRSAGLVFFQLIFWRTRSLCHQDFANSHFLARPKVAFDIYLQVQTAMQKLLRWSDIGVRHYLQVREMFFRRTDELISKFSYTQCWPLEFVTLLKYYESTPGVCKLFNGQYCNSKEISPIC